MSKWIEIADGVYQARYEPLDISVCLVRGEAGLLLVDTRCNPREAAEVMTDVAGLGIGEIRWVVNTHAHYDHSFGNQVFAATAAIHGHAGVPAHFDEYEGPRLATWSSDPSAQPQYDWNGVVLTPPTVLVDSELTIDLGGRSVVLTALGPGHTETDLVVHVPDADVWIVGDVIEESGPPMYGSGSFPLGWPGVLTGLAERISEGATVVPGHGAPVDRAFVLEQARRLGVVADAIAVGFAHQEPVEYVAERAAGAARLPLEMVEPAVIRGYTQLAAS
jgi:glyoxylase-like metal-dependent hydrolase (beta-lactamase superfamily II)